MSSTNRGSARAENDDYPSPRWTVHRLLERVKLPGGIWCEPCVGTGNIVRAVHEVRSDVMWVANDINPEHAAAAHDLPGIIMCSCISAADLLVGPGCAVVISNYPFNVAGEILTRMLTGAPGAIIINQQRIGWGGGPRAGLFRELKPSFYQLPQRPSYRDVVTVLPDGKTRTSSQDSTEYGWWVFDGLAHWEMLDDTPDDVRASEKRERRKKIETWPAGTPFAGEPIERVPESMGGYVNNCAKMAGSLADECQMCGGCCPDPGVL